MNIFHTYMYMTSCFCLIISIGWIPRGGITDLHGVNIFMAIERCCCYVSKKKKKGGCNHSHHTTSSWMCRFPECPCLLERVSGFYYKVINAKEILNVNAAYNFLFSFCFHSRTGTLGHLSQERFLVWSSPLERRDRPRGNVSFRRFPQETALAVEKWMSPSRVWLQNTGVEPDTGVWAKSDWAMSQGWMATWNNAQSVLLPSSERVL